MGKDIKKELLGKFEKIGYLDSTILIEELYGFETISKKLDHLKEVKQKYFDKYASVIRSLSDEEMSIFRIDNKIFYKTVFGDDELIPGLEIQKSVYDAHIKNEKRTPEYGQWFLRYYASQEFEHYINAAAFKSKINSKLKDTFIKAELKLINNIEKRAKKLVLEKTIHPYQIHRANWDYSKEVETIRVLSGNYYTKNPMLNEGPTPPVMAYFRHILLKPYLESLLNISDLDSIDEESDEENDFIVSTIHDFLYDVKLYFFESDYKLLVDALIHYFKKGIFPDVQTEIKVRRVNRKKVGWALNQVYRNCTTDNSNLPLELLVFTKERISIFKNVELNENNYRKSRLYKDFTEKPL